MDNAKMGELIRSARKEIGLTQKDIAEKLGITDRAVSKWERGICAPDIATDGHFQDGYMWYDYEAHDASGYM